MFKLDGESKEGVSSSVLMKSFFFFFLRYTVCDTTAVEQ